MSIFKGYVQEFDDKSVWVCVEDEVEKEMWEVERRRFPEAWLGRGAIFELHIDAEDGHMKWVFDCSFLTGEQIKQAKKDARKLAERFGIPSLGD